MKRQTLVIGGDDRAHDLGLALDAIVSLIISSGAPHAKPSTIATHLHLTDGAVRHYCRQTKSLRAWKGQYTFMLDDPEHLDALKDVIRLALWSMKSAPQHRKPVTH